MSLESQLRGDERCEAFGIDMRLRIPDSTLYTYPDVVVACEGARYDEGSVGTLLDPTVIVEVLSPTTEAYDRGEKWQRYQTLPSLQEYLLITQSRPYVELYRRQPGGVWLLSATGELGGVVTLASIGYVLELVDVPSRRLRRWVAKKSGGR